MRFRACTAGLLLVLAACGSGTSETAGPPSVLLIVSDDHGLELGSYGNPSVTTTFLDRLAAGGMVFDAAYTPTAVCTPSRAALYTGRVPARNGCAGFEPIAEGIPIWGELLGPAGYRTGLVGKLGGKPLERFEFDSFVRTLPADDEARDVTFYAEEVGRFLDGDDGRPFCLLVNLRDAHFPFPTDGAPTGREDVSSDPHSPESVQVPGFLPDLPEVRSEVARFYDSVRRLDATVGSILEELDGRGLGESTLVLYTTDHGAPFPFAKTTLYEAGIRIPLIARWPGGVPVGSRTDALISMTDILPTLLELAGAPAEEGMDGRSLVRVLSGETQAHRDEVFATHTTHRVPPDLPARAVVREGWKYIRNFREGSFENLVLRTSPMWKPILKASLTDPLLADRVARLRERPVEELYHIAEDPYEAVNLAGQPEYAEKLEDLRERVRSEMERTGDPLLAEW